MATRKMGVSQLRGASLTTFLARIRDRPHEEAGGFIMRRSIKLPARSSVRQPHPRRRWRGLNPANALRACTCEPNGTPSSAAESSGMVRKERALLAPALAMIRWRDRPRCNPKRCCSKGVQVISRNVRSTTRKQQATNKPIRLMTVSTGILQRLLSLQWVAVGDACCSRRRRRHDDKPSPPPPPPLLKLPPSAASAERRCTTKNIAVS